MSSLPPVSVVVPTLNEEKYLLQLLDSLAKIDLKLEIIVVDGHSDDGTVDVVKRYQSKLNPRHSLQLINSEQRHIAAQKNRGAKAATHKLLLFCDADVIAPSSEKFTLMIQRCIAEKYAIASARMKLYDGRIGDRVMIYTAYWTQRLLLLTGRPFFGGAWHITPKDTFITLGGYTESLRVSEDVEYAFRAATHGPCHLFKTPVQTSARRFIKYGYGWVFKNFFTVVKVLFVGKLTEEKQDQVPYPFGEY